MFQEIFVWRRGWFYQFLFLGCNLLMGLGFKVDRQGLDWGGRREGCGGEFRYFYFYLFLWVFLFRKKWCLGIISFEFLFERDDLDFVERYVYLFSYRRIFEFINLELQFFLFRYKQQLRNFYLFSYLKFGGERRVLLYGENVLNFKYQSLLKNVDQWRRYLINKGFLNRVFFIVFGELCVYL